MRLDTTTVGPAEGAPQPTSNKDVTFQYTRRDAPGESLYGGEPPTLVPHSIRSVPSYRQLLFRRRGIDYDTPNTTYISRFSYFGMNESRRFVASIFVILWAAGRAASADELPNARPVPRVQVEPLPHHQATFSAGGRELTRYHFDPADRRPFLYPLVGPSGRSLTRMGHPHDPVGHSHHNSVWVAHHLVNGVNFWGDRGPNLGRIVPQRVEQYDDGDEAAALLAVNHWVNEATGEVLVIERRRIEVRPLPGNESLTVVDLQLAADKKPVTFDKTPFGLFAVRMRKTIGVHDGGGTIRNSAGGVNEKGLDGAEGVFWKPAHWCDYSGQVSHGVIEGVTLFDHPTNPNHPTVFHVRDDGWMGSCLTFDASRTVEPGAPLRLRYGLYTHGGLRSRNELDAQWKDFTELPIPASLEKQKAKP